MTASDYPTSGLDGQKNDPLSSEEALTAELSKKGVSPVNPDWQEPDDDTDEQDRVGELDSDLTDVGSESAPDSDIAAVEGQHSDAAEPMDVMPDDAQIALSDIECHEWAGYTESDIQSVLEAALFAYGKPLAIDQMLTLFQERDDRPSARCINYNLQQLTLWYQGRGVQLTRVRSGYRFQTATALGTKIQCLWDERPGKYSRATLETLALIAYRQPITRGEIEDVRGVSVSSQIIRAMLERQWIRIIGHRDVPGRPALFATTREFLDYFGLESLSQLPSLAEIREFDELAPELNFDETQQAHDTDSNPDSSDGFGFDEPYDGLAGFEEELARDLASSSQVNDQFEALLVAQHATAQELNLLAESAKDGDIDLEWGQLAESSITDIAKQAQNLDAAPLTDAEQQHIIAEKLAHQRAIIEKSDKEDDND